MMITYNISIQFPIIIDRTIMNIIIQKVDQHLDILQMGVIITLLIIRCRRTRTLYLDQLNKVNGRIDKYIPILLRIKNYKKKENN